VKNTLYQLNDPIDNVFNDTEEFTDLSQKANIPISQVQCINIALVIFLQTRKNSVAIHEWRKLPVVQQTWVNFKNHFRDARNILEELDEITTDQSVYSAVQVQELVDGVQQLLLQNTTQENIIIEVPPSSQANFTQQDQSYLAMYNQVQQLQQKIQQMNPPTYNNQGNQGQQNTQGHGRGRGGRTRGR